MSVFPFLSDEAKHNYAELCSHANQSMKITCMTTTAALLKCDVRLYKYTQSKFNKHPILVQVPNYNARPVLP